MTHDCSAKLRFLPVGLDVQGKCCLVVGGGDVGTRKVLTLIRAGAVVTVISPTLTDELTEQVAAGRVRWVMDTFQQEHLGGELLVVAATDDQTLNATVARHAVQCGSLVCDASSAERSQVIFGALLPRDDVTVAVFTDGRDPAKARQTRDRIADLIAQGRQLKRRS